MRSGERPDPAELIARCLAAFIGAGSLDLSLDQLARVVGVSKRMLIHYFGSRETLEIQAIGLLEERLRASFSPEKFPPGVTAQAVVSSIWDRSTDRAARGTLRVIMDISRRGWSGSERAKSFYAEQQRVWLDLLKTYIADTDLAEELLQMFQGAVLVYLVTGDSGQGRRALNRLLARGSALQTGAPRQSVRGSRRTLP